MAFQSDGKIVVAGYAFDRPSYYFAVARYNANGSLDTTFNGTGKVITDFGNGSNRGYGVALQSDGKTVVAGLAFTGSSTDFALARYNMNGTLDTNFHDTGMVTTDFEAPDDEAYTVAVQNDGKIVVAGISVLDPHNS